MTPEITIGGKRYKLCILRVIEHDEQGRPSHASIGYDDTVFDLSDERISRKFVTAWIPVSVIKGE